MDEMNRKLEEAKISALSVVLAILIVITFFIVIYILSVGFRIYIVTGFIVSLIALYVIYKILLKYYLNKTTKK